MLIREKFDNPQVQNSHWRFLWMKKSERLPFNLEQAYLFFINLSMGWIENTTNILKYICTW